MENTNVINPFDDNLVKYPRRIERAIIGLNDKPLEVILKQFEELETDLLPRRRQVSHAQLVISPAKGFGKSHLIGRLFHKLSQRATLVYLRPFEDSATYWKSILGKIVRELKFPDKIEIEYSDDKHPTQLEALAHGILIHLLIDAVESGAIQAKNNETVLKFLRGATVEKFRKNKKWVNWVRSNYNGLVKQCSRQLEKNGIHLSASHFSWLGVLFTYAYFPDEFELRQSCIEWLEGGSIDMEDAKQIGIRLNDIAGIEITSSEINEICKYRILDFCQLSGFFRPFVFCFDQTDNYGKCQILSKSFGTVIETLVAEGYNQLTLATANQKDWRVIIEQWGDSHLDRLSKPYLELEGLNKEQAMELIEQRFKKGNIEKMKPKFIGNDNWLDSLFPEESSDLSARDFLEKCKVRWLIITNGEINPSPLPISECYKKCIGEIKKQSEKRLVFDADTFYWLIYEAASGLSDLVIEKYQSPKGYFSLVWKIKDWQILFGFESGSNGSRWQGITREAKLHYDADHHTKIVIFRTPELPAIPGPKWKKIGPVIEEAKKEYLHILILENDEIAKLYAAYDLYADTVEGNIDFQRHEVLAFIRDRLKPFWERIQKPLSNIAEPDIVVTPPTKISKELVAEIRNIVRHHKFMSIKELIKELAEPVSEELIDKAHVDIPEIKVYDGPNNMKVIQWQSTSEQSA